MQVRLDENNSRPELVPPEMSYKEFPRGSQNIALNRTVSIRHNLLFARWDTDAQIYDNTSKRPNGAVRLQSRVQGLT
jgi:hypothetical protein